MAISIAAALPGRVSALDLDGLREAASAGEPDALFQLATRYEQADTVEHDIAQAAQYMRLAAERGHPEAQYRLGLLLAAGLGLEKDLEESYAWLTLAAAGEGRIALLAAALRDAVAADLPPAAVTRAEQRAARFQPSKEPPTLPTVAAPPPAEVQLAELATLLPSTNCGQPVLSRDESGQLIAAGFSPAGTSPPAAELLGKRGVSLELTPLEPELCTVLDLIAAPPAKVEPPPDVLLRAAGGPPKQLFNDGEYLVVELPPLPAAAYAAIDYFVHDGSVVHMLPSSAYPDNQLAAGTRLVLGDPKAGGQTWQISAPFGRDLLVVLVSPRPLYEGLRAGMEPIADYLSFLKRRLAGTRPEEGVRVGWRVVQTTGG